MRPWVIAHRTCPRDAPENSLAGIAKAIELGADAVEIDVRRTADGEPVLMHDRWLLRTARRPWRVDQVELARLRGLRLSGGESIPTLAEALAALGSELKVAIDVKDPGAGEAVVSEIRNQGLEERVLFWSKHEPALRVAASRAPDVERSLLRDTRSESELIRFLHDALELGARGVSAHWSAVPDSLRERCRGQGIRLYSWCKTRTIDESKLAVIDGLVTDWPGPARQLLDGDD
jgi:glycerophosphoryl diester phosphodiesterase